MTLTSSPRLVKGGSARTAQVRVGRLVIDRGVVIEPEAMTAQVEAALAQRLGGRGLSPSAPEIAQHIVSAIAARVQAPRATPEASAVSAGSLGNKHAR
jgi:hypothetical protein